jgi:hypothetical protein
MKHINFVIAFILMLLFMQLNAQSQWITSNIPFIENNQYVNDVSLFNADAGYVCLSRTGNGTGNYGFMPVYLYKTENKGANWSSVYNFGQNVGSHTEPAVKFVNQNTGFVALIQKDNNNIYRAVIYKTTDGCISWNSVTINDVSLSLATPSCEFEFVNENTGYASYTL